MAATTTRSVPAPSNRYEFPQRSVDSAVEQAASRRDSSVKRTERSTSGIASPITGLDDKASDKPDRTARTTTEPTSRSDKTVDAASDGAETPSRSLQTDRSSTPADRETAERTRKPGINGGVKSSDALKTAKDAQAMESTVPGRTADGDRKTIAREKTSGEVAADSSGLEVDAQDSTSTTGDIVINGHNNTVITGDVYVDDSYIGTHGYSHYPRPYRVHRDFTFFANIHLSRHWWHWDYGIWVLNNPWNSCGWVISVPWNGYYGVTYFYPTYHRRFVFCSIGGYWPSYYRYQRYYWYGCHPYRWYGSYVYEQPVIQEVNNHYYYNPPVETTAVQTQTYDDFSDVRMKLQVEKLEQEVQRLKEAQDLPNEATASDMNFEQAVESFAKGDYDDAILKFRVAMILDPEDMILPFAYAQALFSNGDYEASAGVLRATLNQMPRGDDKETVYYPRGLYNDEKVLQSQMDTLQAALVAEPANTDLNLLYAYHMLGLGQTDKVAAPLAIAMQDPSNQISVEILAELLEKVKADRANAAEKDITNPNTD
ncbi:MAG: hypothetical protein JW828_12980 [Sedimentisphaerales bacterium]|nr:hypothetical protein [Sedimentisphaerales bacterium]